MTDEEDDDDEERTVFIPPDALIEWERIQLRPIPEQFQSQSQSPPLSDPDVAGGIWSTIHEDYRPSVVFPPVNHEGIHLYHHHHHHQDVREIDIERAGPPSPISSPRRRPAAMGESAAVGWLGAGLAALRFKFVGIVSFLRSFPITRELLRSQLPLAGSMALLFLFCLRFRRRRRRRIRGESIIELIRIIKEKDERIYQLLHQIARMNEVLLATHHGVPMISKAAPA